MSAQSARLNQIFINVESISSNLNKSNKDLSAILANTAAISDSIRKANLLQTVNEAQKGLQDFATIMDKINKGQGSLGLLVNDDKLYNHLDSTASNLDKLMVDLKANPSCERFFCLRSSRNLSPNFFCMSAISYDTY